MSDIIIDVDGLLVEVDEQEYNKNADAVIAQVRSARESLVGDASANAEEYTDFDNCKDEDEELEEIWVDSSDFDEGDEEAEV